MDISEEDYLRDRLDNQINWYDKKSQINQKWFKILKLLEIIAAAIIPFLAGIGTEIRYYSEIIGVLGILIAVSAGLSALYRFHENWIEYRTVSEILKHEKYLYLTKCTPYDDTDTSFIELVKRIEGIISKENAQWSSYLNKSKEKRKAE